jgi:CRISPR-associated protein Cmr2
MHHLFTLTLGPVQDFIASARRTRDLWFGSTLLSEISKAVAKHIVDTGHQLIFPNPAHSEDLNPSSAYQVVNKIVALINTPTPAQFGQQIAAIAQQRLQTLRDQTFATQAGGRPQWGNNSSGKTLAEQQVADLLEIYWACEPLPSEEQYAQTRNRLEAKLAARKHTRDFRQHRGNHRPKSSIDGIRESIIPEEYYAKPGASQQQRQNCATRLFDHYAAKPAERLSGVDLLKRIGHFSANRTDDAADFPSTSHIAALPFLHRWQSTWPNDVSRHWQNYLTELRRLGGKPETLDSRFGSQPLIGRTDASLLFIERLADDVDTVEIQAAQGALTDLLQALTNGCGPEPYYVILQADGDFMGSTIDHQTTIVNHRGLSAQLNRFAGEVQHIIAKHSGALVYAGGDDVLAFLPLHTALECAHSLAATFADHLQSYHDANGYSPSLSVGLAICHHIEPLSDCLNLARAAEKHAKANKGDLVQGWKAKNALAITLSKRSGVDRTIVGGWDTRFYERLNAFTFAHQHDHLPDGAAYDLVNLAERLGPAKELQAALIDEALRILKRKRGQHGQSALAPETQTLISAALNGDKTPPISVRQLADELIITSEFARAMHTKEVAV